jgi:hypothetical protein
MPLNTPAEDTAQRLNFANGVIHANSVVVAEATKRLHDAAADAIRILIERRIGNGAELQLWADSANRQLTATGVVDEDEMTVADARTHPDLFSALTPYVELLNEDELPEHSGGNPSRAWLPRAIDIVVVNP